MKAAVLLYLSLAASLLAGISVDSAVRTPVPDPLPNFVSLLRNVDGMSLYEGLPHRLFEKDAFETEKRTKKVFTVDGEFFYEAPLDLVEADGRALQGAFEFSESCAPYTGPKLCGGFHADYMIRWSTAKKPTLSVLLCFGCGEAIILAADKSCHADLSAEGYKTLSAILRTYWRQRPRSGFDGLVPKLQPPAVEFSLPKVNPSH